MKEFSTAAVVLDSVDVFDADRSLLVFTEERGIVWARAKGVRRPKSSLAGHLLPFLPTQLTLSQSEHGNVLVTAASVLPSHRAEGYSAHPLLFSQQTGVLVEVLRGLLSNGEPHADIYHALIYTLDRLRENCSAANSLLSQAITAEFAVKAISALGYLPELYVCVSGGHTITSDDVYFSSQAGGLQCAEHRDARDSQIVQNRKSIVVMRQFVQPAFVAELLRVDALTLQAAIVYSLHYAQTILGRPVRSLSA
jgi:DNA repair protein RecO (recombination protein O)